MGYLRGFVVTFRKLFEKRVTIPYPEQKRPKPDRLHGRHVLSRYEDGMEKCIGCELCAAVCPADCIYVRGADNPVDDPVSPGERFGFVYEINYLRCIHCDLCVEACPTEAITETKLFEFSFTNRSDAIYTKDDLLVDAETGQLAWKGTIMEAAENAKDKDLWPQDSATTSPAVYRSQGRRLELAGRLVGVHPELDDGEREQIASRLEVPTMSLRSAVKRWSRRWPRIGRSR